MKKAGAMNRGTVLPILMCVMFLFGIRGVEAVLPTSEGVDVEAWRRVQAQLEAQGVRPAYSKTGGDGTEETVRLFPAPDLTADWTQFGRVVAIDGDTMVVGSVDGDVASWEAEYFFDVFERNEGGADAWGQVITLSISDPQGCDDAFGGSVAISGDTIVVGARAVWGCSASGFVFERNEGGSDAWGQVAALNDRSDRYPDLAVSVAIDGDRIVVGGEYDWHYGSDEWVFVFERNWGGADAWGLVGLYEDPDPESFGGFGSSVSLSGDTLVVGAPWHSGGGAAYVYQRPHKDGDQSSVPGVMLLASDGAHGDRFGTSVSISGDTVVVGASRDVVFGFDCGSAYIFERDLGGADAWGEAAKILAPEYDLWDPGSEQFGISVSIDGDRVVIGAPLEGLRQMGPWGSAFIFERSQVDPLEWGLVAKIQDSNETLYDYFGVSVAMSGDTVVVGAEKDNSGGEGSGSAWVLGRDENGIDAWGIEAMIPAPGALTARGDFFGGQVAADGNLVVVGASGDDESGWNSGAVYVFDRHHGGLNHWGQVAKLVPPLGVQDRSFGESLAVSDDTVVVGAPLNNSSGAVFVFERNRGGLNNWGRTARILMIDGEPSSYFGESVSLSGDTLVVSEPGWDGPGSILVFDRNEDDGTWGQTARFEDFWWSGHGVSIVSISEDTIVAKINRDNDRGVARVIERHGGVEGGWGQVATLRIPDDFCQIYSPREVLISGDHIGVRVRCDGGTGPSFNALSVFERVDGGADEWSQVATFGDEDGLDLRDAFSMGDEMIAVYDRWSESISVFQKDEGGPNQWGRVEDLVPSDDGSRNTFGRSVAVEGATVVVGAWEDENLGRDSGSAYVYRLNSEDLPDCTPIFVAAAASFSNSEPSWASDLGIMNRSDQPLVFKMQFLPRGEDNSGVPFTEAMALGANSSVNLVDVWGAFAGEGAGSINVCVGDVDAGSVTSRIYTTHDEGTMGQSFVGKVPVEMIVTGETARLGFLAQNADIRTNVGFLNAGGEPIVVDVDFFQADGTPLGTSSTDLPPYSSHQWNRAFVNRLAVDDVPAGAFIDVSTDSPGATFLAYASVIDNHSDDPITIWPFDSDEDLGGDVFDCIPIWVAAAASFPDNSPPWASDLGITNLGADTISYRFQFLPRGEDNSDVAFSDTFNLGGNKAVAYGDIWGELGGTIRAGAINVCLDSEGSAGVISRIYSYGVGGSYGQSFDGVNGEASIQNGEKARLAYLFENSGFRTNIGVLNTGSTAILVAAEFFDGQGNSLGYKGAELAPFSNFQWNRAFSLDPINASDIEAGFVDVWSDTPGAAFLTFASVVDNGTGDPTTIWPR